MEKIKMHVAIPSNIPGGLIPGGLDADRAEHFGHCDLFTVVDINENNEVKSVEIVKNVPHDADGCMAPALVLQDSDVKSIIVSGMGARPMQGFNEVGITIYYADQKQLPNVTSVVENLLAKKLPVMHCDQACTGSGNCHH